MEKEPHVNNSENMLLTELANERELIQGFSYSLNVYTSDINRPPVLSRGLLVE